MVVPVKHTGQGLIDKKKVIIQRSEPFLGYELDYERVILLKNLILVCISVCWNTNIRVFLCWEKKKF